MRSSSGRPDAWYFLAIDTTRRRFDCTNVRSASSPSRSASPQLALLGAVRLLPPVVELRDGAALPASICLGEADLVVLGEQRVLPDVGEVQPDEVFLVPLDAILATWCSYCVDSTEAMTVVGAPVEDSACECVH